MLGLVVMLYSVLAAGVFLTDQDQYISLPGTCIYLMSPV